MMEAMMDDERHPIHPVEKFNETAVLHQSSITNNKSSFIMVLATV